jgi:hydroxyquinol 1,2-dioxygenase
MKNIDLHNLTATVQASFDRLPGARTRVLLTSLVKHLHSFAQETQLTHEEWRAGLNFVHDAAKITSDSRSEFSLMSDVLGLSSLVDLIASKAGTTPGSVLGPFHTRGSPWMTTPVNLLGNNTGQAVVLRGSVKNEKAQPLANATVDFWQNADNGLYWQQDPEQAQDNLRCQFKVDATGCFGLVTIRPKPYTIPTDGPIGRMFRASERSPWRPAHNHIIVEAQGYKTLVTELFDPQDPYLESDAVFGVREALVTAYQTENNPEVAKRHGLKEPYLVAQFDIVLAPATA